jgi:neutral ceramidase
MKLLVHESAGYDVEQENWKGTCAMKTGTLIVLTLAVLLNVPAVGVELQAGVAKTVITPEDMSAGLIGVMGEALEAVNHDIHARALSLFDGKTRIVIVTYDLNCLDVATPLLRVRLRDELGIDPACFIPMATHNHCAPIQIVPGNFAYGRWLADKIFAVVQEAIAAESGPARLLFGSGQAYMLRAVGNAPVDYDVQVLKVTREDAPVAVFFNQASHPMQIEYNKIGVGHPGLAMDNIEAALPGAMALHAMSAGGNQFITDGMKGTPERVAAVARQLSDTVLAVAHGAMVDVTGPLSSELEVISLPLADPLPLEAAKVLAAKEPAGIGLVPYPHDDRGSNWIRALTRHYNEDIPFPKRTTDRVCTDDGFLVEKLAEEREFPCNYEETIVSKLGDLVFVSMQGEVCAPIGMRIKDAFRAEHPIMVNAYMGEHNLYIPSREIVRLNVYQARVIQTQYASPVGWAPTVENEMVGAVNAMVRKALRKR